MQPKSFLLPEPIADHLVEHNPRVDDVTQELVAETRALGEVAGMQISPERASGGRLLCCDIVIRRRDVG